MVIGLREHMVTVKVQTKTPLSWQDAAHYLVKLGVLCQLGFTIIYCQYKTSYFIEEKYDMKNEARVILYYSQEKSRAPV